MNKPLRQFIISRFFSFLRSNHHGVTTEGVKALAMAIARMMLFSVWGPVRLASVYVTPSWGRLLKGLKGAVGLFWSEKWLGDEGQPNSTFFAAGIPAKVARNITPGREEPFEARGLVRVNRAQIDGEWVSNLYFFSLEFLEYLACCKRIPIALVDDLVEWVNLQKATIERFQPKVVSSIPEITPPPYTPLPVVQPSPVADQEPLTVDLPSVQEQKNFSNPTDYNFLESTTLRGGNMEYTDHNLGKKCFDAVDNFQSPDNKGPLDLLLGMESANIMPTKEETDRIASESSPYGEELDRLEGVADQALRSGWKKATRAEKQKVPDQTVGWLEKLGCRSLAAICKRFNSGGASGGGGAAVGELGGVESGGVGCDNGEGELIRKGNP